MVFFLNTCTDSGILSVIYFVKKIIDLVFIILPLVLIVMTSVDLAKNVMAKGEDDMKKNTNTAIKRILYCVFAFFVPTIVNVVMNAIYDVTSDNGAKESYLACWTNANLDTIKAYREQEEAERKAEEEQQRQENEEKYQQNQDEIENNRPSGGLSGKDEEEESGNTGSSGSSDTTTVNNYTIYVGDSRTNGMCNAVSISSNEECIAKDGSNQTWLTDTAYPSVKSILDDKPTANVVINMGTNDVNNIDNYVNFYKKLTNEYINAKIVVVSLTPVDDNKAKANGYSLRNADVNDFNSKLQSKLSGTNIKYCDVNSKLTGELYGNRDDGIHHNNSTYKIIYEEIKKCL